MRISDWSSDVCSSDLAVIHAGANGAGQAAKICNNMILGATMIATCEAFALAKKLGLDAQAFYDIASVSSGQSWSMTSYCPVPGVGPESRSEEHTSELQSLMRNSYAVFCLKKKKK